ncbi:MAG: serine hydrolase, partial [Cyclobacteriaceae bacterium]
EIVKRARYLEPTFSFRSGYGYSNLMYIAAGEVLEEITDTSWSDYIQYRILNPLGMKRTNTSVKLLENIDNVASPHVHHQGKQIVVPYLDWDNAAAAAAINSSVSDMSKWLIFQLNFGKINQQQYIHPSKLWYLQTNHTLKTISQRRKELWPSTHFEGYGLGWSLFDYHGKKIVGHGGGSDGMISRVTLVPEENFGFVILTNNINYLPPALSYYILDDYFDSPEKDWSNTYMEFKKGREREDESYWQHLKNNRVENTEPTMKLEEFKGIYTSKMYGDVEVSLENGSLMVNFEPAPDLSGILSHWHYNTFIIELMNINTLPKGTVKFLTNEHNEPVEMKINIPNPDFHFTELKLYKQK